MKFNVKLPCTSKDNVTDRISVITDICSGVALAESHIVIQGVFKKRPNFCYKDFIFQHFKHCPLQSSPLYWRYTVPNVSSIVGMLPGTHFSVMARSSPNAFS
jgi:hypothetical protein